MTSLRLLTREHFRAEYQKVEPMLNIFSGEGKSIKKLEELEQKLDEKEKVIESLVQSGNQKASEISELRDSVKQLQTFMLNLEKYLNAPPGTKSFKAAEEESKKQEDAFKEYFALHPELKLSSEEKTSKVSEERAESLYQGAMEFYRKKNR